MGKDDCEVEEVTNNEIKCRSPRKPVVATGHLHSGGAGVTYTVWKNKGDFDVNRQLKVIWDELGASDGQTVLQDMTEVSEPLFEETKGHVGIMMGFFKAPYTGEYKTAATYIGGVSIHIGFDPAQPTMENATLIKHCQHNNEAR